MIRWCSAVLDLPVSARDEYHHDAKPPFAPAGVNSPQPFLLQAIRRDLPREQWPTTRTYTVRRWDADAGEAAPSTSSTTVTAASRGRGPRVEPGEESILGPGGAYTPDPEAHGHLFAGDAEARCRPSPPPWSTCPPGTRAGAFIQVEGPEEEQPVHSPGDVKIVWLHRGDAPVPGERLVPLVRELDFPLMAPCTPSCTARRASSASLRALHLRRADERDIPLVAAVHLRLLGAWAATG